MSTDTNTNKGIELDAGMAKARTDAVAQSASYSEARRILLSQGIDVDYGTLQNWCARNGIRPGKNPTLQSRGAIMDTRRELAESCLLDVLATLAKTPIDGLNPTMMALALGRISERVRQYSKDTEALGL